MMRLVLLIALLMLSACDNTGEPATCKGPVFNLNSGRWTPTPLDLKVKPIGSQA